MLQHVIVSFARGQQYDFDVSAGSFAGKQGEEARKWFEREFAALDCRIDTPTGKILAVDRILGVARQAGANKFAGDRSWAEHFARATAAILGRDLIRVDVGNNSIGY